MPLVRISLVKGKPEAYRRKVGDAVHLALVDTVAVPRLDRFQLITEHEPGDLVYDSMYLGIAHGGGPASGGRLDQPGRGGEGELVFRQRRGFVRGGRS